jgi:hypothetical protein
MNDNMIELLRQHKKALGLLAEAREVFLDMFDMNIYVEKNLEIFSKICDFFKTHYSNENIVELLSLPYHLNSLS